MRFSGFHTTRHQNSCAKPTTSVPVNFSLQVQHVCHSLLLYSASLIMHCRWTTPAALTAAAPALCSSLFDVRQIGHSDEDLCASTRLAAVLPFSAQISTAGAQQ